MRNTNASIKVMMTLFSLFLGMCFTVSTFAQGVLPQAGQTIDKSNYQTYKEFFPEEFLEAFTTGWELIEPLSITIMDPVENPVPQPFLDASEKNIGKYSLDDEGYIAGGDYKDIVGFPFPDITPEDENFVTKFMWNFDYRYRCDDMKTTFMNVEKRRGSTPTISVIDNWIVNFQNRMYDDPKPLYETKNGIRTVIYPNTLYPPVQKNFLTLMIRYIDQKKQDDTYIYLPSMRRVLRGEAGQRSTPINSSTQAPDDFEIFSGRIPDFNYKLVGEKKMIVLGDAQLGYDDMKDKNFENIPVETENWMLKDVYIIDIIPKDEKYPQGRKRIWVDKKTYWAYYGAAWDRAGALWKVWQTAVCVRPLASGDTVPGMKGTLGMDIQLGYAVNMFGDDKTNGTGLTEADVSVANIRKRVR